MDIYSLLATEKIEDGKYENIELEVSPVALRFFNLPNFYLLTIRVCIYEDRDEGLQSSSNDLLVEYAYPPKRIYKIYSDEEYDAEVNAYHEQFELGLMLSGDAKQNKRRDTL